jgi:hypothetical protein
MGGGMAFFELVGNLDGFDQIATRRVEKNGSGKTTIVVRVADKRDDFGVVAGLDGALNQHAALIGNDVGSRNRQPCARQRTAQKSKQDSQHDGFRFSTIAEVALRKGASLIRVSHEIPVPR